MADIPVETITEILLQDGWHQVEGVARIDFDPAITNPGTGLKVTPVAGPWLSFTEKGKSPITAPIDRLIAIRTT